MSPTAADRCRELFNALVGRRSGIVRQMQFATTIDGDAPLHHAAAVIANAHPGWNVDLPPTVGGSGRTREEAIMAVLGEGLERYLASAHSQGRTTLQSHSQLGSAAVSPEAFCRFSEAQRRQEGFPFQPISKQTPLRWVTARRLSDDSRWAAPAFAVYLPYRPERGEPLIAPGLSTGLACGDSLEAAVLAGLYEIIERDALALTWLTGSSPRPIAEGWLRQEAGDLLPPTDTAVAYDLTTDVSVPVVLVVCRGKGPRGPLWSVGSACRLDSRGAVRKAALEASQDRVYVRQLLEMEPDWRPAPDFSNVTDFSRHARLYSARPELADEAFSFLRGNFLSSDLSVRAMPDSRGAAEQCQAVIKRLVQAGHDASCVNLTPRWASDLRLHVVRMIVPSLMPLHGHQALPYLGHPRLAASREALPGSVVRHEHTLWPYPHPFP